MNAEAQRRALIRTDVWHLLARAFSRPDSALLTTQASVAGAMLMASELNGHPLRDALRAFAAEAAAADARLLEQEFHQLFTTQMLCPPNEGAYHQTSRGAVLGDIAAFYEAFGLRIRASVGAPDSLAHELHFLAWMALKEARAIHAQQPSHVEVTRNATRSFLSDHLGRWAHAFAERLAAATPSPYYNAAARLLMEALNVFTGEFAVRDVIPLDESGGVEPNVMPCPAAGLCDERA